MRKFEKGINADSDRISSFVEGLRAVRDHNISPGGWQDLRLGVYMGGNNEYQIQRKQSFGNFLVCPNLSQEEWDEAWDAIVRREKEDRVLRNLDKIERERRAIHIDAFLSETYVTATASDRERLHLEISTFVSNESWAALEEFLLNARSVGISEALRRQRHGGKLAAVGFVFWGIESLFEVFIAWRLLAIADTAVQKIVVALLLLAYARLSDKVMLTQYRQSLGAFALGNHFTRVYRLLKDRPSLFWHADETAFEETKNFNKGAIRLLIFSTKYLLIALMGGWALFATAIGL